MSYTETTTTSWFSRIKNALVGILVGIVLVIAAIWLLFWNEGRAIQTYRALAEGASLVISVDSTKVDPSNEGKEVHISGPVKANGVAVDDQFGIEAPGALAITRDAEMYQWVEKSESKTEKNVGGSETTTTTYSYVREWRTRAVDSSDFKQPGHDNPPFIIDDSRVAVDTATVGAFTLEGNRVANLGDEKQIMLSAADVSRIAGSIATDRPVKLNQGGLYLGRSAGSPQIGDTRVRFERTDLAEASFVGMQQGDRIVPYKSSNGRMIFLSAAGQRDAAAMFEQAQSENTMITWLLRAGGLLGLFIGFKLIMMIFGVLGDIIPFVGSILGFGTSVIALVLTMIIGPIVIAIGWFAYRPLLSLVIIGAGLLIAFGLVWLRRRSAAPAATQTFGRSSA